MINRKSITYFVAAFVAIAIGSIWYLSIELQSSQLPYEYNQTDPLVQNVRRNEFELQIPPHLVAHLNASENHGLFWISDFEVKFAEAIPKGLAIAILEDLSLRLDGKRIRFLEARNPQFFTNSFAGEEVTPDLRIMFLDSPTQIGVRTPRVLRDMYGSSSSFTELYNSPDNQTLHIRSDLIEIYKKQFELILENPRAYTQLQQFTENISNLKPEDASIQWYTDLVYLPESMFSEFEESLANSDPAEFAAGWSSMIEADYKKVSALNISPLTNLYTVEVERYGLEQNQLYAEFEQIGTKDYPASSNADINAIYSNGTWKLVFPFF
ncbi:MAG: hypothetical protein GKR91_05195 [Pseudomonadales bacterium]|nr:hypothetical protein [Pseudomonadales bacterium]